MMTESYTNYHKGNTTTSSNEDDTSSTLTDEAAMWGEIVFSCLYLVVVWCLVFAMILSRRNHHRLSTTIKRQKREASSQEEDEGVEEEGKATTIRITILFTIAFGLLAFGDTFHLVCRIWAYGTAVGDDNNLEDAKIGTTNFGLVGFGGVVRTCRYIGRKEIWGK